MRSIIRPPKNHGISNPCSELFLDQKKLGWMSFGRSRVHTRAKMAQEPNYRWNFSIFAQFSPEVAGQSKNAKYIKFCQISWFCPKFFMLRQKLPFLNFRTKKVDFTCSGTICDPVVTLLIGFQVKVTFFYSFGSLYPQKNFGRVLGHLVDFFKYLVFAGVHFRDKVPI